MLCRASLPNYLIKGSDSGAWRICVFSFQEQFVQSTPNFGVSRRVTWELGTGTWTSPPFVSFQCADAGAGAFPIPESR